MSLEDLYQEVIIDHFRNPRCYGCVSHAPYQAQLFNPLCGDQIALSVNVADGVISEIGFAGKGCSISQASTSIMAAACKGKSITEAQHLLAQFRAMMRGEKSAEESEKELGDAVALQGVRKFSARIKCAMLGWEALERCLEQQNEKKG